MLKFVMLCVGLTGGLSTGKTTVTRLFEECGALVVDADVLARQVVQPGRAAWRDLVSRYGRGILHPDGTVDRKTLAKIVFHNHEELQRLNAIVHPRVAREQARLTRTLARRRPHGILIYDAPLLIEAGAHERMDRLVVVTADRETQITRLRHRNGFSRREALRRIRAQMPLAEKRKLADYVIDGTLPLPKLRDRVKSVYEELRAQA